MVSPIMASKGMKRHVCFFKKKHQLFSDIVKDSANSNVEIKRFRSSDNNHYVIGNQSNNRSSF